MILTRLPPGPLHHAMQVSKRFHDAIDPKAPSSVSSMRVALGLLCRRKIEDMTPSEHAELAHRDGAPATPRRLFYDAPQQTLHRRFHWLLNVTLDPVDVSVVRDTCFVPVPTLSIAGSNTIRIVRGDHAGRGGNSRRSGDESSNILTLNFSYVAKGFEQDKPTARGIIRSIVKSKDTLCPLDPGAGWFDVKILTMPFDVRVCVSVDFRDAMQATGHHVGPCRYFGCQVGNHGVQVRLEHKGNIAYVPSGWMDGKLTLNRKLRSSSRLNRRLWATFSSSSIAPKPTQSKKRRSSVARRSASRIASLTESRTTWVCWNVYRSLKVNRLLMLFSSLDRFPRAATSETRS
jgi:hypothetical protein